MSNSRLQPPMTHDEILAILRAADDIIGECGRTMLAKILKGSKDKKLLAHGLNENPGYGYFAKHTIAEITEKIDWMLTHDFLRLELSGDLPMIAFTERGWAIERAQRIEMFLAEWDAWLAQGKQEIDMTYLKDRNREMMLLFLERVRETGDKKYVPYLRQWAAVDYKKVRAAIQETIAVLEKGAPAARSELLSRKYEELQRFLEEPAFEPHRLKCRDCGERFVFDAEEQLFFRRRGFRDPKRCPACRQRNRLLKMGIDPNEWV